MGVDLLETFCADVGVDLWWTCWRARATLAHCAGPHRLPGRAWPLACRSVWGDIGRRPAANWVRCTTRRHPRIEPPAALCRGKRIAAGRNHPCRPPEVEPPSDRLDRRLPTGTTGDDRPSHAPAGSPVRSPRSSRHASDTRRPLLQSNSPEPIPALPDRRPPLRRCRAAWRPRPPAALQAGAASASGLRSRRPGSPARTLRCARREQTRRGRADERRGPIPIVRGAPSRHAGDQGRPWRGQRHLRSTRTEAAR